MYIIFDLDDTLYNQFVPFKSAYDHLIGQPNLDLPRIYLRSREISNALAPTTGYNKASLKQMQVTRLQQAFTDFGYAMPTDQALAFQEAYAANLYQLSLWDNFSALLDVLTRRGVPLGILTNGPTDHQQKKIAGLGLSRWIPAENIFISEAIGADKPDPKAFVLITTHFHCAPNDLWMVGDNYAADIVGAKACGWHTLWFNHRHYALEDTSAADIVCDSSTDLFVYLETLTQSLD